MNILLAAIVASVIGFNIPGELHDKSFLEQYYQTEYHSSVVPEYAKLIAGKWEVSNTAPGRMPVGSIIEYTKDGVYRVSIKPEDKTKTFEGSYVLDGDKLTIKLGDGERQRSTSTVKVSENDMSITGKDGYEILLKRVK